MRLRKRKKEPPPKPKPKVFHRCPNKNCNALIPENELHTEIVYLTEPATIKIMCPHCGTRLQTLQEGEVKIGLRKTEAEAIETPIVSKEEFRYDLIIDSRVTKSMLKILSDIRIEPRIEPSVMIGEDEKMHILFSSAKQLSFEELKKKGWVTDYTVT